MPPAPRKVSAIRSCACRPGVRLDNKPRSGDGGAGTGLPCAWNVAEHVISMEVFVEILTRTKSGADLRLTVERDRYSVYQIYAAFKPSEEAPEEKLLCHGWGNRKTPEGIQEGIIVQGALLEVPRSDWKEMFLAREDLRDRDNLEDICLVKVFSRGDALTIDGYTLSARVDRATWKKIAHCMEEVDSGVNNEILSGDCFAGWIVKAGMELEVERLLGVKPENSCFGTT